MKAEECIKAKQQLKTDIEDKKIKFHILMKFPKFACSCWGFDYAWSAAD